MTDTTPRFQKTTLASGIRVVSEHIPSVRSVAVGAWIAAGSRDEVPEENGMAHFIEHMVFKGTRRRRAHHIAQRMESVGGYLNAFTSKEYTCYYARGLDEHLDRALDVVLDLVVSPTLPERELEKEKEVVVEEMKMYEDAPEDHVFDHYEAAMYPHHALGRPVLGVPETVRSFTRDRLLGYIDAKYAPNRLVVAVAGNVDHDKLVRRVEKLTAEIERAPQPVERLAVNGYDAVEHVERRPIQQAHLVIGARALGLDDPRRTVLTTLNTVLGGGMSSRLSQNIREKYGYCYNIYSFANMISDTGDFGVYMGTDAGKVERSRKLIGRELDKLAQRPVSPRALGQAKNQLKGSLMLGLESMSNRMMRLGRIELAFERYFTLDEVIASIDAVTAEEMQALAAELFAPDRLSTVAILPEA
ncbi:MAG: pitrilysin family protein [Bacteroidota bacterium]